MEKNPQQILEELIHRELSKLPVRSAPATLLPRVLAQVRARTRKPWWQRPWPQWPLALQLASIPLLMAGAGGAVFGATFLWNLLLANVAFLPGSGLISSAEAAWDICSALGNAFLVFGRAIGREWLLAALLVPCGLYLTCIGLGTLCYRMAFQRR